MLENTPTNAGATGDAGSIHGWEGSPGGGNGKPTPVSILASKSHGQRSLVDCGPWCHKESDVTEVTEHTCTDGILTCTHFSTNISTDLLNVFCQMTDYIVLEQ